MVHFERWKIILVLFVCVMGVFYALPNVLPQETRQSFTENLPSWGPQKTVKLGLDLQGGVHLLYEVDIDSAIAKQLEAVEDTVRKTLGGERVRYRRLNTSGADYVEFTLRDNADRAKAFGLLHNKTDEGIQIEVIEETAEDGSEKPFVFRLAYDDATIDRKRGQIVGQMIEVVRRRIDPDGVLEPLLAPQGEGRVLIQVPGVSDSQWIKDRIGKQAVLSFHQVRNNEMIIDPNTRPEANTMLLPAKSESNVPSHYWMVDRKPVITGDMLVDAQPSFDQRTGDPVVSFRFNSVGARRFGEYTSQHTGELFAIVLDGVVISAPRVNEPILGGSGIISGNFTIQEVTELSLLLRAGALPTTMEVVEERTVGPSLGADSIEAGKQAAIYGMAGVIIFILLVYGRFGAYANVALLVNVVLIFAILSMFQATLTLPGIAGIVLTVGMAVDANVLIFERIKEETALGRTPIAAIDAGYSRALTTIIDANVTTLIAAVLLYALGSGPIRGFAVTLTIGILTSMFTAIMVTRLMVVTWLRRKKPATLTI